MRMLTLVILATLLAPAFASAQEDEGLCWTYAVTATGYLTSETTGQFTPRNFTAFSIQTVETTEGGLAVLIEGTLPGTGIFTTLGTQTPGTAPNSVLQFFQGPLEAFRLSATGCTSCVGKVAVCGAP